MKSLNKLFLETKIEYKETIIISLIVGVFCGIVGGITNTSFTDMAGGYEFWVVSAVIICANSKNFYSAGLKCGLYFLITQPLQFYVQALLYSHNFANAFYYFKIWLPVIALTVPGGMIAYFVKKQNIFGAIVLGLGNTIEAISFVSYLRMFLSNPPRHILSTLFSFISIFVMSFVLQKNKVNRLIAIGIAVLICAALMIYAKAKGLVI